MGDLVNFLNLPQGVKDRMAKLDLELSEETSFNEFLKIWQELYYCMYMADKPLLQENLADEISELIHKISDAKQKILFFKAAVETFSNQWNFIDEYRMDKFFMARGGNIFWILYRLYYESYTEFVSLWVGNPMLTAILFGIPLGFLSLICYSIWCSDILDEDEVDLEPRVVPVVIPSGVNPQYSALPNEINSQDSALSNEELKKTN